MAKLTTAKRKSLPAKDFAVPGRKFPVNDRSHARNALARVAQDGTPKEKAEVKAKVHKKFPGMGMSGKGKKTAARRTEHAGKGGRREAMGHDAIGSHMGYTMGTKKKK